MTDPAEYLNCEDNKPVRGFSFSKYDTRVTKSTTDLTKDLQQTSPQSSAKSKSIKKADKNKSIFGGVFKRNIGTKSMRENRKSNYLFNATDVTLSQNEIVKIFAKVKNREMSQEDALAAIKKRGLNSSNPTDLTPSSSPETNVPTLEKNSLLRKGRLSKSMIKRAAPTAQFYTKDVEHHQSLTSLKSEESPERRNSRSMSLYDIESVQKPSTTSPELAKSGIFKSIRNSIRKKGGRLSDSAPEKSISPSSSTSSQESITLTEVSAKVMQDAKSSEIKPKKLSVGHKPPPPPPPVRPAHISLEHKKVEKTTTDLSEDDSVFEERRPSLKIKSYEKYQEEISKRRSQKTNTDVNSNTESDNMVDKIPSDDISKTQKPVQKPLPPPRQAKIPDKNIEPIAPKAPPRLCRRSTSSASSGSFETSSIDAIGQEMNKLIAGLNDELTQLNDTSPDEKQKQEETKPKKPLIPPRSIKKNSLPINIVNTENIVDAGKTSKFQGEPESPSKNIMKGNDIVKRDTFKKVLSLKQMVKKKLTKENIHLSNVPYTLQNGQWNIPYALIERYGLELQQPVDDIMKIFEEIRTTERTTKHEITILFNIKNLHKNSVSLERASLDEWLVLIGLPMFLEDLKDVDIQSIEEVSRLSPEEFKSIGVFDEKHVSTLLIKAREYCSSSV